MVLSEFSKKRPLPPSTNELSSSSKLTSKKSKRARIDDGPSTSMQDQGGKKNNIATRLEPKPPPPTANNEAENGVKLLPKSKRARKLGRVQKLGVVKPKTKPQRVSGTTKQNVSREGAVMNAGQGTGGFGSSSAEPRNASGRIEEIWVTRKTSYAAYLKKGLAAFIERGCRTLQIHALGAALPLGLSLSLAIPDALPGGQDSVIITVKTDSVEIQDEIVPDDDMEDLDYQTRTKSSIEVSISLLADLATPLVNAADVAKASVNGCGRSFGRPFGRGRGRGRGNGHLGKVHPAKS